MLNPYSIRVRACKHCKEQPVSSDTTIYAVGKKSGIEQNIAISLKAERTKQLYFNTV